MSDHTLGSAAIETQYREQMIQLARAIDKMLNGEDDPKTNGFILMMFKLGTTPSRCNYVSNAHRDDVKKLLREQLRYFEGAPDDQEGHA